MIDRASSREAAQEVLSRKISAQSFRLQVTWSCQGDAIERAVVRDLPEGAGSRVALPESELHLVADDIHRKGDSPAVDELFALLERSFRMAGADPRRHHDAESPVSLVTDENARLTGIAFLEGEGTDPDSGRDAQHNSAFLFPKSQR